MFAETGTYPLCGDYKGAHIPLNNLYLRAGYDRMPSEKARQGFRGKRDSYDLFPQPKKA